ncbi:DCL family protein [Paraburkholderia tropica]|uniref:DCL family protein n=1 Tax=Paraburkholderia tropica TaxID=92647 RepID=UPI002AB5F9AD|nr:DCL family protein [Paraburkholderia tropica]
MTKQVDLPNGRHWSKQGDAMEHFRDMLHRYSNGEKIANANDHDDLSALLVPYDASINDGSPTKIGPGISHFTRELNKGDRWRSAGFHVHRVDGTSTDFSYIEAVRSAST